MPRAVRPRPMESARGRNLVETSRSRAVPRSRRSRTRSSRQNIGFGLSGAVPDVSVLVAHNNRQGVFLAQGLGQPIVGVWPRCRDEDPAECEFRQEVRIARAPAMGMGF